MTKLNGMTLWLIGALVLAPVAGWLGYEGGRIVEYQRAIKSAEHAGAARNAHERVGARGVNERGSQINDCGETNGSLA